MPLQKNQILTLRIERLSDDASADCSQLNCSARFWMGVKNLEIYI